MSKDNLFYSVVIPTALTISLTHPILAADTTSSAVPAKTAAVHARVVTAKPVTKDAPKTTALKSSGGSSQSTTVKTAAVATSQNPHKLKADSQKIFYEGVSLLKAGKPTEAIARYQQAINMYGLDPAYYNELGVAYQERGDDGDYVLAEKALRKAISISPKHAAPWLNLGACLNHTNDFAGAEAAYRKALELEPNDWHAHQNLAVNLYASQKMTQAKEEFQRAIDLKAPPAVKAIAERAIKEIDSQIAARDGDEHKGESDIEPTAETKIIEVPADKSADIDTKKGLDVPEPVGESKEPSADSDDIAPLPKLPAQQQTTDTPAAEAAPSAMPNDEAANGQAKDQEINNRSEAPVPGAKPDAGSDNADSAGSSSKDDSALAP